LETFEESKKVVLSQVQLLGTATEMKGTKLRVASSKTIHTADADAFATLTLPQQCC